jgi:hypothetical protein
MPKRLALLAAFAAAQLAVMPAFAQHNPVTSASAELLGYTLTDLAPDDGIAPSVVFTTNPRDGRATIETAHEPARDVVVLDRVPLDPLTNSATASVPGAEASVSIAGTRITTSTWRDTPVETTAWGTFTDTFVLSPHTRLTLDFAAQVGRTDPLVDMARSTVIIRVGHDDVDGNELGTGFWWLRSTEDGNEGPTAQVDLVSGATESLGYVDFYVESHAWSVPAAPVPEPHAWAMLAAGLLLVMPLRRRRAFI